MPEIAYVNGRILPFAEATVSINDRGFCFGDAVYEVITAYNGRLFLFDAHLERLRRSLNEIRLEYIDVADVGEQIQKTYESALMPKAMVYLQISRGVAPRSHAFPAERPEPTVIITVREFPHKEAELAARGVGCITVPDIRWARVDIKTTNLLPNVLAKQQAVEAGCYEAIFIGADERVLEGTSSNIFVVKNDTLFTHPTNHKILPGITRRFLIGLAEKAGIAVREEWVTREGLYAADEVILSGTTTEVTPVLRIDDRQIGSGRPGPVTQKLYELFLEAIRS
ncbi:MAG TPA: D-amino-acid transaminase [bacterium]|nr:D-amino-acid transaminase [bacterium]